MSMLLTDCALLPAYVHKQCYTALTQYTLKHGGIYYSNRMTSLTPHDPVYTVSQRE